MISPAGLAIGPTCAQFAKIATGTAFVWHHARPNRPSLITPEQCRTRASRVPVGGEGAHRNRGTMEQHRGGMDMEGVMKVHLVGSIALDTVEEIFRTVGTLLGPHLSRVPDGEVGGRRLWISWQYPLLRASAICWPDPSGAVRVTNRFLLLTLAEGVAPGDVRFGEPRLCARGARLLSRLHRGPRQRRAAERRPVSGVPADLFAVELGRRRRRAPRRRGGLRARHTAEVAALCRHILHHDLCIQWDLCNEMIIWDGQRTDVAPHPRAARGAARAHAAALPRRARRRRARAASLLRRFRRQAISSSQRTRRRWSISPTR